MSYSRRDLTWLLPAVVAGAADAQTPAAPPASPSHAFRFEDLPVKISGENRSWAVLNGVTHSAFPFDIHQTELGLGMAPHPPHRHVHEEMLMIREGLVEVTISGKATKLGPGSVAYVASNEEHGWKNVGTGPAQYFVIAFGRDH